MNPQPRSGFPQVSPQLGRATHPPGTLPPPTQLRAVAPGQVAQIVATPSEATPYTADRQPMPRFSLHTRAGEHWSYPYSYVGLIEMPSPECIAIHCNSREAVLIEIKGRQLGEIAKLLAAQKLVTVTESEHAEFSRTGVCVSSIVVSRAPSEC